MSDTKNLSAQPASFADRYLPQEGTHAEPSSGGGMLNLAFLRALVWRQRYIVSGIIAVSLLIGLVITMMSTPIYQATATVRVELNAGTIVEGQELLDPSVGSRDFDRYVQTLAEVMQSRSMANDVAKALKLGQNPAVTATNAAAGADARQRAAAGSIMGGVSVTIPRESQIIGVNYQSPDPQLAARLANAYVDAVLRNDLDKGAQRNAYARQYLEEQIAEVRGKLQQAEVVAIGYARQNRIVGQPLSVPTTTTPEGNGGSFGTAQTLTASNLTAVNQSLTDARSKRIQAEQRWNAVSGTPAAQVPEVQNNASVNALRAQMSDLNTQLADLRQRYRDDYPQVRELVARISTLNRQIGETSNEIKNSIRREYEIALRQEQGLEQELGRVSDATLDEQDRRVRYNLIDREAGALRTQLDTLLDRYNQITAASNLQSSSLTKLDEATVPGSPVSPDLMKNLLVALILGMGLAAAVAVIRETMDDRLRTAEDIERKLGIRSLGQTPYVTEGVAREISDHFSPISEAYSSIRATLDYALKQQSFKVIQFTSSQASEGKSTTAVALAREYASLGRKTLIVDLDLRRPAVTKLFDMAKPDVGLVDVLYSRVTLERALLPSDVPNLDILPVGRIPTNPVEILSSGLIAEFFDKYRSAYDVIIVDSSPVMGIADAPLLSRFSDGVVFVVEANRAHFGQARSAIRRLQNMDARIIGAVLTKFRALEAGESYNYQYQYYSYDSRSD